MKRTAVLGSGSWGTALAKHAADIGHEVVLWGRRPEQASAINATHENAQYLPGVTLPPNLQATASLKDAFSFEKRPTEKPAFNEQNVNKSFFVDPKGKAKTFLCGWAAEETSGIYGESWFTTLGHHSAHCNIQFEITEKFLIGKMINPSFLDKPEKWVSAVKIPIEKHYYSEK